MLKKKIQNNVPFPAIKSKAAESAATRHPAAPSPVINENLARCRPSNGLSKLPRRTAFATNAGKSHASKRCYEGMQLAGGEQKKS